MQCQDGGNSMGYYPDIKTENRDHRSALDAVHERIVLVGRRGDGQLHNRTGAHAHHTAKHNMPVCYASGLRFVLRHKPNTTRRCVTPLNSVLCYASGLRFVFGWDVRVYITEA